MFNRYRAHAPSTVFETSQHIVLDPVDMDDDIGPHVRWALSRIGPFTSGGDFKIKHKLAGQERSVARGALGRYATGWLGGIAIGSVTLDQTRVTFDATEQVANGTLAVVGAGVLKYLEGYDETKPDQLRSRIDAAVAEDRQQEAKELSWLHAVMPAIGSEYDGLPADLRIGGS